MFATRVRKSGEQTKLFWAPSTTFVSTEPFTTTRRDYNPHDRAMTRPKAAVPNQLCLLGEAAVRAQRAAEPSRQELLEQIKGLQKENANLRKRLPCAVLQADGGEAAPPPATEAAAGGADAPIHIIVVAQFNGELEMGEDHPQAPGAEKQCTSAELLRWEENNRHFYTACMMKDIFHIYCGAQRDEV